jgi:RNA polymerase sigma-70 factor (ECF subfamily)
MDDDHKAAESTGSFEDKLGEFTAIVAEYEAPLLRYAARLVNSINAAEDIVQVSFIKLFRKWKEGTRPSPQLSSWLYRVTHNGAVDYLRRETRRRTLHRRHAEDRQALETHVVNGPGQISEAAENAVKQLKRLSFREQQVVILKVFEEKSYREISEISGLTETNVGYILHHAMKKMASGLKTTKAI